MTCRSFAIATEALKVLQEFIVKITVIPWISLDKRWCLLCVVHWTSLSLNFIHHTLYDRLIAPGFECHISKARYNNTPPFFFIFFL